MYPSVKGYCKFNVIFTLVGPTGFEINFNIGKALPLTTPEGEFLPKNDIYSHIYRSILILSEKSIGFYITCLILRIYISGEVDVDKSLSAASIKKDIVDLMNGSLSDVQLPVATNICNRKKKYKNHITQITSIQKKSPLPLFMVADMETLLIDNVQMPYAIGLLVVRSEKDVDLLFLA